MVKPTAAAWVILSTDKGAAGHIMILDNCFKIGPAALSEMFGIS